MVEEGLQEERLLNHVVADESTVCRRGWRNSIREDFFTHNLPKNSVSYYISPKDHFHQETTLAKKILYLSRVVDAPHK